MWSAVATGDLPGHLIYAIVVFSKKKLLDYLEEIYPSHLTAEKANDHLAPSR